MTNKTPLTELIEHLEIIQKTAITDSFYNGINCGITKAQSLLEKEKNIIVDAWENGKSQRVLETKDTSDDGQEYFTKTFITN